LIRLVDGGHGVCCGVGDVMGAGMLWFGWGMSHGVSVFGGAVVMGSGVSGLVNVFWVPA